MAWTTTPWTLPSNTALAVGAKINYLLVETKNQYTGKDISVIIAKDLAKKYFKPENEKLDLMIMKLAKKSCPLGLSQNLKVLFLKI